VFRSFSGMVLIVYKVLMLFMRVNNTQFV